MPSYDFEVDLPALGAAAQGTADAIQLFKDKDVEDLVPSKDDVAHDAVWDALDEFKDRWERGVNDLMKDVEEVSGRLGKIAMNYFEYDQEASKLFTAVTGKVSGMKVTGGS